MAQVSFKLASSKYARLQKFAQAGGATVPELLDDIASVSTVADPVEIARPIRQWSDAEVLKAARAKMPAEVRDRLGVLLDAQQSRRLTAQEEQELSTLLSQSELGELRMARALREAVRRKLIKPVRRSRGR